MEKKMNALDHAINTASTPEMTRKVKDHLEKNLQRWADDAMLEIRMNWVDGPDLEAAAAAAIAVLCQRLSGPIIVEKK